MWISVHVSVCSVKAAMHGLTSAACWLHRPTDLVTTRSLWTARTHWGVNRTSLWADLHSEDQAESLFLWVCVDTQTVQFYCRVFYNRHTTEKLEEWARLVMVSCHWWWWKSQSVVGAGLEIQNHSSQCIHVFGKGHGSKDWVFILNNFKFQWADHNSFAL